MKFKVVLDDKRERQEFATGWGVSVYFPDFRLLFDTGENPSILEQNLSVLDIERMDIKHVFLTGESWEYAGGLESVIGVKTKVYLPEGVSDDMVNLIKSVGAECCIIDKMKEIIPSVFVTGPLENELNEQFLYVMGGGGISVFTGSPHSEISKVLSGTRKLGNSIDLVFGRINSIARKNSRLKELASRIDEFNPNRVAPSHCNGEEAISVFSEYFGSRFVSVEIGTEGDV